MKAVEKKVLPPLPRKYFFSSVSLNLLGEKRVTNLFSHEELHKNVLTITNRRKIKSNVTGFPITVLN